MPQTVVVERVLEVLFSKALSFLLKGFCFRQLFEKFNRLFPVFSDGFTINFMRDFDIHSRCWI